MFFVFFCWGPGPKHRDFQLQVFKGPLTGLLFLRGFKLMEIKNKLILDLRWKLTSSGWTVGYFFWKNVCFFLKDSNHDAVQPITNLV